MIDKIYLDEEEINEVTLQAVASAIYDLYDGGEYVTIPRTAVKAAKYAVAYAEQLIHDKLKYERENEPVKEEKKPEIEKSELFFPERIYFAVVADEKERFVFDGDCLPANYRMPLLVSLKSELGDFPDERKFLYEVSFEDDSETITLSQGGHEAILCLAGNGTEEEKAKIKEFIDKARKHCFDI